MPFLERDDVSVYYEVEGNGPAIFLLPGASMDSSFWRNAGYIAELAGEYRPIAIDPRGFGRSSRPRDPAGLRWEEVAADVVAVADVLELDRFALWGHSAGGSIAFIVGAAEPARVTAIVGSGAPLPFDEAECRQWHEANKALASALRASDWEEFIGGVAAGEGFTLPDWMRQVHPDMETLAEYVATAGDRFRPEWLRLEPPTLALLGEQEANEPPGWQLIAPEVAPNVEFVILPGLGHLSAILDREQTMRHVRPFLARVATAEQATA